MSYYPVALDLRGRRCVVVGGGPLAEQKVLGLLDAGALVTVVSPTLTLALVDLARRGTIEARRRPFAAGDLEGAWLAIAGAVTGTGVDASSKSVPRAASESTFGVLGTEAP